MPRKFDDKLPDDFVQQFENRERNLLHSHDVPVTLESTSFQNLCQYCKAIDSIFKHLDPNITSQQFPFFYKTRTELFLSAGWCQFCEVLVDALQDQESYYPELTELQTDDGSYTRQNLHCFRGDSR